MRSLQILTSVEQVAEHLRSELLRRRWTGDMPGADRLASEFGVGNKTAESALQQLEREGLLLGRGRRRKRLIAPSLPTLAPPTLRIIILCLEKADRKDDYMLDIQHSLENAGHAAGFATKSLVELGMDLPRIARFVKKSGADAWVVVGAPHEVLQWFVGHEVPALALFGRRRGLALAGVGPDKPPVMAALTRRLIALGHKRIVLLARKGRRLPQPGATESTFLNELAAHGIPTGDYNLPDWKESIDGFHQRLASLFTHSAPTALIVDEAPLFTATQQFLAGRGLRVPEDVSLVSTDDSSVFEWSKPAISHISWDSRPVVRRVVRWATNVSRGKKDLRQTLTAAEFVKGGTIGPAAE